jgi:Gpi18-like mannosyltransferase
MEANLSFTESYSEPLFALCTFSGMYFFVKKEFLKSSICWCLGSLTRANGILMVGFYVWEACFVKPLRKPFQSFLFFTKTLKKVNLF